ncbi:MAG: hypothetical protein CMJ83_18385 [Planctomycetes bacterium]|nr:hypothetical protein [Planctomycetota bacterium]
MPSNLPDSFRTLDEGPKLEIKIKASRFIGQVFHAVDEESARAALTGVRKRYHDARHHCSAWRVGGPAVPLERSDDDGEPSASAGPPILEAIRRAEVFDVAVIVTRYFGGTKLGKGGLIRAYDEAARHALEAAPPRDVWCDVAVTVQCGYDDVGTVEAILARFGDCVVQVNRVFDGEPTFTILVRRSRADDLREALVDGTAGRGRVT